MVGVDIYHLVLKNVNIYDNPPTIVFTMLVIKPWKIYSISRLRELWWVYREIWIGQIAFFRSDLNYF